MGAFINSPADQQICQRLSERFSDKPFGQGSTNLDELRTLHRTEPYFGGSRHLVRLAWRLQAYPDNTSDGINHRGRWYHLLRVTLKTAANLPTHTKIIDALRLAITDTSIKQVIFTVTHGNIATKFDLNSWTTNTPSTWTNNVVKTLNIQLVCQDDVQLPDANEPHPPAADSGEFDPITIPPPLSHPPSE
jgi:hypothetical protein